MEYYSALKTILTVWPCPGAVVLEFPLWLCGGVSVHPCESDSCVQTCVRVSMAQSIQAAILKVPELATQQWEKKLCIHVCVTWSPCCTVGKKTLKKVPEGEEK